MCARRDQMEAAVLKSSIVPGVHCNSNPVSGDLQVTRLQELVLRLELHNEQLRTRASAGGRCCPPASLSPQEDAGEDPRKRDGSVLLVLDEVELLDVDLLGCSDDETWLYVSPKAKESKAENTLTPLQWCRQVLDDPDWDLMKRSLCLRLKSASAASCGRRPLANPDCSPQHLSRVAGVSPIGTPCSPLCSSDTHVSSPRPRQSPAGKARTPTFIPHLTRGSSLRCRSPRPRVDRDLISPRVGEDESVTHGYKLQDLTDVQVVARLQEERLRQDYASTSSILATRRSQSITFPLSARPDPEEGDKGADENFSPLPPQLHVSPLSRGRTFSSAKDWRRSSSFLSTPPSAPPHPSAGFVYHTPPRQHPPPGGDKMGRSLPNLAGAPSNPSIPSASLLRNSQSFDSPGGITRQESSMASPSLLHTGVQSVGGVGVKATSFVSPTIKGSASVPTSLSLGGRSGIPLLSKPSSSCVSASLHSILSPPTCYDDTTSPTPRVKAAQSACSLLTPPRSLSAFSNLHDRAWRDSRY
ncbi:SLAIN motif-containing protein 1-like [Dunckerocampus dactyliophorus]|uniref:SLAIN motif-containing protein 1-like n=1 Tax=Dunckerocampus dactyliophorus TaxID=161453 RepID=UPI00240523B3|nr:SLAIN motif-containing protein 1-like [Dunckerocampus dactyliophorus]